jgi:hypothetical protein
MANVSVNPAYAMNTIVVSELFYQVRLGSGCAYIGIFFAHAPPSRICLSFLQVQPNAGTCYTAHRVWYRRTGTTVPRLACQYGLATKSRRVYPSEHAACGGGQPKRRDLPLQILYDYRDCGVLLLLSSRFVVEVTERNF